MAARHYTKANAQHGDVQLLSRRARCSEGPVLDRVDAPQSHQSVQGEGEGEGIGKGLTIDGEESVKRDVAFSWWF